MGKAIWFFCRIGFFIVAAFFLAVFAAVLFPIMLLIGLCVIPIVIILL